jgi:hypothetical protein
MLTYRVPAEESVMRKGFFYFVIKISPYIRERFEGTADSSTDGESFLSILLECRDALEERYIDLDHLAVDMIIPDILCIDSLECPEPDMERDIFSLVLELPHELTREVERCRRCCHRSITLRERRLIIYLLRLRIGDIGR